jgi:G6PDH family F420-dependent oxidoreductase
VRDARSRCLKEADVTRFGYFLASEEFDCHELVEQARLAEDAGFEALWISDHFHPWNDHQGQSPFVWSVIGAISEATNLPVTTAVTCPTVRFNPALIAQAAATSACLLDGRFTLGVGTGEALNEHILGDPWPSADTRLRMLEEAVGLIRQLWTGETITFQGEFYEVDTARIYTLPDEPPPIYMSGFGPKATETAMHIADGYQTTKADAELLNLFRRGNPGGTQAGLKVCHAPTEDEGVEIAHRLWGHSGVPGEVSQILPSPHQFEALADIVDPEDTRKQVACGNDPEQQLEALRPYLELGFDEVYVGNMGPHYADMIQQFGTKVLPAARELGAA